MALEGRSPYGSAAWPVGPGRFAPCATMGSWNIATTPSGPREAKHGWKPPPGSPKKRGRGFAKTPRGRPSPASPSNFACNRPKKQTIPTRIGTCCCRRFRPYKIGTTLYSTKRVVGGFCELRVDGFLGSSTRTIHREFIVSCLVALQKRSREGGHACPT
jgi:hypothetical protein